MNQELQNALAAWLQAALTAVQDVAGQIPPMLWEKVAWGRVVWTALTLGILFSGVVIFAVMQRAARQMSSAPGKGEYGQETLAPATTMRNWSVVVLVITGCIGLLIALPNALEAWIAPRVYLVGWIRSLLQG